MANIYVCASGHEKRFDVINVLLLFWPGSKIFDKRTKDCDVFVTSRFEKDKFTARIRYRHKTFTCTKSAAIEDSAAQLKLIKQTLFLACKRATGICPPWGILTGIRPMSVYEKLCRQYPVDKVGDVLEGDYYVSNEKRNVLDAIYRFRQSVYYDGVENDASLYVAIPFCPSKCSYCSFVSSSIERVHNLIEPYLTQLHLEISQKIDLLCEFGKTISTVYIGGGTPGVLSADQIDDLLTLIRSKIPYPLKEFCFELGRPETVTAQKLQVLQKHNVDRLCINCQTLNDDVLNAVGRRHTAKQFMDACTLALQYGFDSINVDFIAGLPDESIDSHQESVKKAASLGVNNITIHCLSIKRASTWTTPQNLYDPSSDAVAQMVRSDYDFLAQNGYYPYYIYRQKNTVSNGENIGYAKEGYIGKYNIYMMEDVHSVIGCGAGASTKIIHNDDGRIDRFVNTKYPQEYLKYPEKLKLSIEEIRENLKGSN